MQANERPATAPSELTLYRWAALSAATVVCLFALVALVAVTVALWLLATGPHPAGAGQLTELGAALALLVAASGGFLVSCFVLLGLARVWTMRSVRAAHRAVEPEGAGSPALVPVRT